MKPDAWFLAPPVARTLLYSLIAIWPWAAPCGEVQVGRSAPLLEVIGSVCVWEKTRAPCVCHLCNTQVLVTPWCHPEVILGCGGGVGCGSSLHRSPWVLPELCSRHRQPWAWGLPRAIPDGPPPRPRSCAGCLRGLSLARWNTSLQDPENRLEHLEEGVLSSSACKDPSQTEARVHL